MSKEYSIVAEIVTVEGGRCTFRPIQWRTQIGVPGAPINNMILPIDRAIVDQIIDDLIQAAVNHGERTLKIRGGIIRGVEQA